MSVTSNPPVQSSLAPGSRHQRSAKNYLVDRHFQLKYAGMLVGITAALSIALGLLLWWTSERLMDQSQRAVEQAQLTVTQGQENVRRGQQVIAQSRKVSQVVAMNIAKEYKDDPDLAKTFSEEATRDENKLKDEQTRLEKEATLLTERAQMLQRHSQQLAAQQKQLLLGLVFILTFLVGGVGLFGIVFTHKVAGPIYKMKRLLRQIGQGNLVLREKLRKGDELQHFFETFEAMVEDLRRRQKVEISKVDGIISGLESPDQFEQSLASLKKLRVEMQAELED